MTGTTDSLDQPSERPGSPLSAFPESGRSGRKRRAIIDAATRLFLDGGGYRGTSMEEIAALSGVSKQTVYKHFADKEALFRAIVMATVDQAGDAVHAEILHLQETGDLAADLRELARRQLALVMAPRILQLRRLVIGEAARFPELGWAFYDRGPGRTITSLTSMFERLTTRGLLHIDDAAVAAAHFNWLVMSIPLNRAMLLGEEPAAPQEELERYADLGVAVFLAAYGPERAT